MRQSKCAKYTKELLTKLVADSVTMSDVLRKLGLRTDGNQFAYIAQRVRTFGIDTSHFLKRKEYSALATKRKNGFRDIGTPKARRSRCAGVSAQAGTLRNWATIFVRGLWVNA
jgi:hypothetical protein